MSAFEWAGKFLKYTCEQLKASSANSTNPIEIPNLLSKLSSITVLDNLLTFDVAAASSKTLSDYSFQKVSLAKKGRKNQAYKSKFSWLRNEKLGIEFAFISSRIFYPRKYLHNLNEFAILKAFCIQAAFEDYVNLFRAVLKLRDTHGEIVEAFNAFRWCHAMYYNMHEGAFDIVSFEHQFINFPTFTYAALHKKYKKAHLTLSNEAFSHSVAVARLTDFSSFLYTKLKITKKFSFAKD